MPKEWKMVTLNDICDKVTDGSHNPPKETETGLPMLSAKNIHDGIIDFQATHRLIPVEQFQTEDRRTSVTTGDILLTIVGALGRVAVVPNDFQKFTLQRSVAVLAAPQIDSNFFGLALKDSSFQSQIFDNAKGTAQKGIYLKKLRELTVMLPPLAEQKVIADKLDELLAQVESTKARLDAIPAILKSFRQSVLAAAVSGKLTEEWRSEHYAEEKAVLKVQKYKKIWIEKNKNHNEVSRITKRLKTFVSKSLTSEQLPDNWCWGKLEDSVLMIVDCHNKTAPYVEQGIPLIRTSNIRDGQFVWKDLKYVNAETFDYWSKRCVPASGDIIFTREAPMGEAAIIPEDIQMCLGQRTMLIRPIEQCISSKYLLLAIMDPMFQKRSEEFAVGTGVKHYRVGDVSNLLVPVPTTSEQTEIVRRVEELFAFADKVEAQVNAAQSRVNNLTQSILAKAFRGELTADWRAANPELISGDNSAEALLKRIKAERAKLKPVKKTTAKKAKA